jgi:CheY-like chemotaxis protein
MRSVLDDAVIREKPQSIRAVARGQRLVRLLQEKDELLEYERDRSERTSAQREIELRLLSTVAEDTHMTLKSVAGWLRFLRREELDRAGRDHALAVIERKIVSCQRLISDLAGGHADRPVVERVDLKALVLSAIDAVAAKPRPIITFEPDVGDEAIILGDRDKLERAIVMLLVSMLDGSAEASTPRIELHRRASAWLVTLVGPRRRAANAALDGELFALERRLVHVHGGTVRLIDRIDEDVIEIALPMHLDARPPVTRLVHTGLAGARALVVDVGSASAATATFVLRHHGADVLCVGDVPVAMDACSCFEPEVVVLCAEDESAGRLAAQFRDSHPSTGVVVVTEAIEDGERLGRNIGVDAHVVAPIETHVLVNTVEAVIRFARQGAAIP